MTDWDLDTALAGLTAQRYPRRQDLVIARMWAYNRELEVSGGAEARARTEHDRLLAKAVVRYRAQGEKSAEVAEKKALDKDDAVFQARLAYRLAEKHTEAVKSALRILHAELDDLRTQAADRRAGDAFTASDRGTT